MNIRFDVGFVYLANPLHLANKEDNREYDLLQIFSIVHV